MSNDSVDLGALFAEYERTSALTVLDPGKHKLKVASATVKSNGIQPVYEVVEGPQAGQRVMAGGIFPGDSEGGRQAFFRKLEKFGLNKDFFAQKPSLDDVRKALIGRVVIAELSVREWNGEPRNELAFGIKLVSAPALPSVGGVPAVAATTPAASAPPVPAAAAPPVPTGTADPDPGF